MTEEMFILRSRGGCRPPRTPSAESARRGTGLLAAAAARGEPLAGGASSQGEEVAAEPGLEPLGLEYGALAEALLRSPAQDGAAEVGVLKRLGRG